MNEPLHFGRDKQTIYLCLLSGQSLKSLGYISVIEWARRHGHAADSAHDLLRFGRLSGLKYKGRWYVLEKAFLACPMVRQGSPQVCGQPVERHKHYCLTCGKESLRLSHRASARRRYSAKRDAIRDMKP